jgi:hypothetical protein
MNLPLNQSKISLRPTNISNSLIFYLYHKNQYKYTKSFNSIKTFYFDPILKDNVYIASNGLKKNVVFKRTECNENILQSNFNTFVSYFYTLEDNLFKFNLYPAKYFKELTLNYLKKQQIILKVRKKLYITTEIKQKSKFLKNFLLFSNLKKDPFFGDFSKIVLIKTMYLKLYFLTNRGFIKNLSTRFSDRIFFTGLNYIFKEYIKETFRYILVLNYVLLNFFSNIILSSKKNINLLYNIIIYYNFWKFLNFKFFDYLKEKKLRFRKSNILLRKYKNLINFRVSKIIKLYYFLAFKYYTINFSTNNWIKNFIFNNHNLIFNNINEETESTVFLNKINSLADNEKLSIFNYLISIIKYFLSTNTLFYNTKLKLFHKYIYLKSIFERTILASNFKNIKWFLEQNFSIYLFDLFFFKTNRIHNVLYSNEKQIFFQKTLHWYSNLKRLNNTIKQTQKRRFNSLLAFLNDKNISNIKQKYSKLENHKTPEIKIFISKFDNLKNSQLKNYKIKTILKIKKSFRHKKLTSNDKIRKIKFVNYILNSLLILKRKRTLNLPEFNRLRIMIK